MNESVANQLPDRKCPQCGALLPRNAPLELCPKCLLKTGMIPGQSLPSGQTVVIPELQAGGSKGLPQPGEQFGHYEIVRLMGEGGMGAVFEAQDLESGRRVALKVLSQTLDSPEARQRFLREGRLAASLNHPNSVYVFGTEEIGGTPVIAMELIPGGTLQERVRMLGPMSPPEAVDAILQIIAGLEAAQRVGILHRDIKPSNCFLAPGGVVKVGDFGLSISTSVRLEPALTVTGAFLGTPAFCSPEQLRGEELSFRADMYSVGTTLFFLLTGRTPFEGKNVVHLLATVLEKRAPSPRQFRPEIPRGLARVVLRCLEKEPGERFKNYGELAKALLPYGATAPTPATFALRLAAGAADMAFVSVASSLILALLSVNPFDFLNEAARGKLVGFAWLALGAGASGIYYAVFEGIWGAALGKALFRLRVVRRGQAAPGVLRAGLRAFIYMVVPALPFWLVYGAALGPKVDLPFAAQQALGLSFYLVLALLFVTARRTNGFAAIHDLLTGTRVVSLVSLHTRPFMPPAENEPVSVSGAAMLGPYHVIGSLGKSSDAEWLLGYDLRLLRKVWIRKVPEGTPPLAAILRNTSRVGRLRWLAGRRTGEENWDAFEALSGKPLLALALRPQPWGQVKFWLSDLASELRAAEKDGSFPSTLSPVQVWITAESRAKLLDFPGPILECESKEQSRPRIPISAVPENPASAPPHFANAQQGVRFLCEIAALSLQGGVAEPAPVLGRISRPIPLHARNFFDQLPVLPDADAILNVLKPLLNRVSCVTRTRRAAVVAGCVAFPLVAAFGMLVGTSLLGKWNESGIVDLNTVLHMRQTSNSSFFRGKPHPTDKQFAVYIATHFRNVITNDVLWASPFARSMLRAELRRFAEESLAQYPTVSPEEAAEAEAAIKPYATSSVELMSVKRNPWLPLLVLLAALGVYVGLPALLAALLFGGGLVLRAAGITFARKDGSPASRLRVFWRAIVAWSPLLLVPPGLILLKPALGMLGAATVTCLLLLLLVSLSVALPVRGLPERLSGTWPVPR